MSDDAFSERLSRFTPNGGGLDRAAVLFAAGRASVGAGRRWKALAGLLALTQAGTLGLLLWPRVEPSATMGPPAPIIAASKAPVDSEPQPSKFWSLREQILDNDGNLPEPTAIDLPANVEPPLRVFPMSDAGLN